MTENLQQILTFKVDNQRFAIRLGAVEQVIRAVAVTKLTDSPPFIEGVIDYFGEIIAVLNMRKRFGYSLQELKLSDRFIVANTTHRKLALLVDQVEEVLVPHSQDVYNSNELYAGLELVTVLRDDEGIIVLNDLEKLLSIDEEIQLNKLMEENGPTTNEL